MVEFGSVKEGAVVKTRKRSGGRVRVWPLHTMAVNDVFFAPDKKPSVFTTYVHHQGKKLGRKFRTQGTVMFQNPETQLWEPCASSHPAARNGVAVTRLA